MHMDLQDLICLAIKIGGQFSNKIATFLRSLAHARARGVSRLLHAAALAAIESPWPAPLGTSFYAPIRSPPSPRPPRTF